MIVMATIAWSPALRSAVKSLKSDSKSASGTNPDASQLLTFHEKNALQKVFSTKSGLQDNVMYSYWH